MGQPGTLLVATCILVFLAMVFGGGTVQGLGSDALVQLAAIPVAVMAALWLMQGPISGLARAGLWLLAGVLALPLLQLIPLPPEIWSALPGREIIARTSSDLGLAMAWQPVSLDPAATWRAWLALVPAAAVFCATLCLDRRARRTLSLVVVGLAVLALLLGLLQQMQGPASPLRFHPITNPGSSVGFFANRNHHAALLYLTATLAAAWTIGLVQDRRIGAAAAGIAGGIIVAALLLGVALAQSRAGVFLALASIGLSMLVAGLRLPLQQRRRGFLAVLAVATLGFLLVTHYALAGLMDRFEASPIDDYRFSILGIALDAGRAVQPTGSGFGTFQSVYLIHDRPDTLLSSYVNHAHNDWLELWIEGGWAALGLALAFLAWFGTAMVKSWRREQTARRTLDDALTAAAGIGIILLVLHSLLDYPLRTTTLMVLFAFCCALLVDPLRVTAEDAAPARSRRRRSRSGTAAATLVPRQG